MTHNPFAPVLTHQPPQVGQWVCSSLSVTTCALPQQQEELIWSVRKLYNASAGCDDKTLERLGFSEVLRLAGSLGEARVNKPGSCNQCVCGIDFSSTDRRAVHILELSDDDWFGHKMLWAMMRSQ